MSETEAPAGAAAATDSPRPGRALAKARAARHLTVAEVAQQLKLSATQVDALEADAYERLPGPVFVRGFVRNYARLLELDADSLVNAVDLPHAPAPASAAIPLSRDIPFPARRQTNWLPYAGALLLVVGAIVLFEVFFSEPPAMTVSAVPPRTTAVPVEVEPQQPQPQSQLPAKETAPEISQSPPDEPLAAAPSAQPAESQPQLVPPVQKPAGTAEVHLIFDTPSWVEVRDRNDRILFSQLNPAGGEQRVQGRPPLSLVVGNARGVRLNYNGQPFDLAPHTRVEVARFTLE